MLGSILGDIIGSVYEFHPIKTTEFPWHQSGMRYTDDTVLTLATMEALMSPEHDYAKVYRKRTLEDPHRGYGGRFIQWALSGSNQPYNSFGNGSAMRVAPVAWAFKTLEEVLAEAKRCAEVTHNHPEGIKGAQAVACACFMARTGSDKERIKSEIESRFGYDLERSLDSIRPGYRFTEICQTSVPQAILAFLESDSMESAIRLAISLGGDADTQACIAGGIAEAFYGPLEYPDFKLVESRLSKTQFWTIARFYDQVRHQLFLD